MTNKESSIGQTIEELSQRWRDAKPTKVMTFWIVVGAVVIALYLGFSRAGWVTDRTSQQRADISVEAALLARLTPICVAQFNSDPEKDEKLVAFQALTTNSRRSVFVKEQGWATMPGETDADNGVTVECSKQIKSMNE